MFQVLFIPQSNSTDRPNSIINANSMKVSLMLFNINTTTTLFPSTLLELRNCIDPHHTCLPIILLSTDRHRVRRVSANVFTRGDQYNIVLVHERARYLQILTSMFRFSAAGRKHLATRWITRTVYLYGIRRIPSNRV